MLIPNKTYGILEKVAEHSVVDGNVEDILSNGFTILNECFSEKEIEEIECLVFNP